MDLSHLVREVLDGPRVLPEAEEVRVEADLGGELLLLSDPLLLATALDNLVRNATDAADRSRSAGRGDHRHHSEICAGAAHLHHHAAGLEAGATHSQTLHP